MRSLALALSVWTAGVAAQSPVPTAAVQAPTPALAPRVVTVPWLGNPANDHVTFDGASVLLHGVAYPDTGVALVSGTWDPGDGSGPVSIPVTNPRALERVHVYRGSSGTPYVARLEVVDANNNRASDTFRVRILPRTLAVDVNMAIDRGLWNLHKRLSLGTSNGVDVGYWTNSSSRPAATASGLLAMQANAHFESGDRAEDPYVDDVARGLAGLMTDLSSFPISAQTYGNPDTNGNGFALECAGSYPPYVVGQVVDAIVGTRTPNKVTVTGPNNVLGRTYRDITTDLLEAYYFGQSESGSARGGWRYAWNYGSSDNSVSQWYAIGALAVVRDPNGFAQMIPQFVKDENLLWLQTSQVFTGSNSGDDGRWGYTAANSCVEINCMNTTASGLVEMIADDRTTADPRWIAAERFAVRNWTQLTANNRIYGMFAVAKAMRLAQPNAVQLMDGTLDWYGDGTVGLAQHLVRNQQSDGSWDGRWVTDDLATAWAIVILSPTIIQVPPVAVCHADPQTTAPNTPIDLDALRSHHPDPNRRIMSYEWDFDCDGTIDATGVRARHPGYPTQGDKCVRLWVIDDANQRGRDDCTIHITPPPYPPNSNPGGPYDFCLGTSQRLILDGRRSSDPDGTIVRWAWDYQPQPLDLSFNDAFGSTVDVTAYFSTLPPGRYDVGLRVRDNNGLEDTDFTTVTVYSTSACPLYPPDFVAPTPCGGRVMATAGVPLEIRVCAMDRNVNDIVTLDVVGSLPAGARMDPVLPVQGNPVCSTLKWTPGINQVGRVRVTFSAIDNTTLRTDCSFEIEVAECFLMMGGTTGNSRIRAGTHTFQTGLGAITAIHPITRESLPTILATPELLPIAKFSGEPAFLGTAQLFMWNPAMFPNNPEQASHVLELWLVRPGVVQARRLGTPDGISAGVRSWMSGGRTWMNFPFTIDGM